MLRAFRNCGILSEYNLKSDLSMASKRVTNFVRDNYLEPAYLLNAESKEMETVYRLTKRGRNLVDQQLNLRHCYRSSGGRHDLAVASMYFSLSPEERASWQTESELNHWLRDQESMMESTRFLQLQSQLEDQEISATDGAYLSSDGRFIAVEIITSNYGKEEIAAKEQFAEVLGMELQITKI